MNIKKHTALIGSLLALSAWNVPSAQATENQAQTIEGPQLQAASA